MVLLLVALMVTAMCLGAAEAAMLRVRASAVQVLADRGDRRAQHLLGLVDDLPRVMNTILLVVLLVQIGAATVTGLLAERHFGNLGITIASIGLTLTLFVYAEAIPKTYALRHPLRVAQITAPVVGALKAALHPVVSVLIWFADLQAPGQGIAGTAGVTEDELRRLAAEAAETGQIEPSDAELMERAFRLGDKRVDEILVPRIDIVAVASVTSARIALDRAIDSGHRRLPVFGRDSDDIIAVVHLRDLARAVADNRSADVGELALPILVTPESKKVVELLREMQRDACHFAVVVDEHGGTAGIVTIEDVVEELVGRIADEGEDRPAPFEQVGEREWRIDATVPVSEIEEALDAELPAGEWRTIGGLVVGLAGDIPHPGDRVRVGEFEAMVTAVSRKRVREVILRKQQ
ncbi:MAG: HlyC/CorC family transporter [bacterium]|nr:HlyC/CorC family transporter [bacterium]